MYRNKQVSYLSSVVTFRSSDLVSIWVLSMTLSPIFPANLRFTVLESDFWPGHIKFVEPLCWPWGALSNELKMGGMQAWFACRFLHGAGSCFIWRARLTCTLQKFICAVDIEWYKEVVSSVNSVSWCNALSLTWRVSCGLSLNLRWFVWSLGFIAKRWSHFRECGMQALSA